MLVRKILYWSNYTIIRWQLIFCAAAVWVGYWYVKKQYGEDVNADQWKVLLYVLKLFLKSIFILFALSLSFAFSNWFYFMYKARNKKIGVQTHFDEGQAGVGAEAGFVPVTVSITGFRGFWLDAGFFTNIRARLVFSGLKLSEPILLDEKIRARKKMFAVGIKGTGKTMLHDRGIYDLQEIQLQFFDMFRLIALPYALPISKQLFTLPQEQKEIEVKASPNTTEEQTQRIEIPKRVEGEYINYKDFETGDDVRRIVWKIYARSGQLVVRIPETMDPYASHLYFYASFYNGLSETTQGVFETELLNGYKDKVRNLFEALQKNGFDVRIPHDQEVQKLSGMSDKKNDLFHVAAAHWQKDKSPMTFVQSSKAAFVCMSSLTPAADVAQLLGNLPFNVPVVVVRLSDAIVSPFRFRFKTIFFRPDKDPNDDLRSPWLISPLRNRMLNNEREILRMLQQRGNAWLIPVNEK